jgi:hypothetical protein
MVRQARGAGGRDVDQWETAMSKGEIISRAASLVTAACYLCLAAFGKVPEDLAGPIGVALIIGLPLIWFPEPIGSLTGYFGHGAITVETPPFLVALGGWMFLIGVPALVAALLK